MARERVEFDVVGRDVGGSKAFKDVGDAAEKAGDKVDDLGDELRTLDRQVLESKAALVGLAQEFERTGNTDLFKDFRKQRSQLRQLMNLKSVMDEAGDDAAHGFTSSFLTRVGPFLLRGAPASLGPVGGALGGALALEAVEVLGTATAGAIIGGAGVGGVIGGLLIASKHPAVKSAAQTLGVEVTDTLQHAAIGFVPAAVRGIDILRDEFTKMRFDLDRLFFSTASFVEPLTRGAAEGIREVVHGIAELGTRAGPVIDVITAGMRRFGDAIQDGLFSLSDNADEAASGLAVLFMVLDVGIRVMFAFVNATAEVWGGLQKIGHFLGPMTGKLIDNWVGPAHEASDSTHNFSGELQALITGFAQTGTVAGTAEPAVTSIGTAMQQAGLNTGFFADELDRLNGDLLTLQEAKSNVEGAIDALTASIKANGKTLNLNTEHGRNNAAAFRALADSARKSAEDTFKAKLATGDYTGAQKAANDILTRAKSAYIDNMTAITGNRKEAKRLADQIFGTPKQWKTTFEAETADASAKITGLQKQVKNLHGKTITITTRFITKGDRPGEHITGGIGSGIQVSGASEGGLHSGPGTSTSDDIVTRVSNGEFTVRAAAVRALGVDFFDALNQADKTGLVKSASSSGSPTPRHATVPGAGFDEQRFAAVLRRALSGMTLVIDDRTGRTADLIARSG